MNVDCVSNCDFNCACYPSRSGDESVYVRTRKHKGDLKKKKKLISDSSLDVRRVYGPR